MDVNKKVLPGFPDFKQGQASSFNRMNSKIKKRPLLEL
jgi:hypothetical protein